MSNKDAPGQQTIKFTAVHPVDRAADPLARLASPRALFALVVTAMLVGAGRRILVGWDAPLWLDESFTGAVAIRPAYRGVIEDSLKDLSGFLYYSLIWAWEKIAGPSNVMLRLPSLFFALATPLMILSRGHPDRTTRWVWAGVTALWVPGAYYAAEARAYALLFFLGALQVIAFAALLRRPALAPAFGWAAVSAILLLIHSYSLVATGLQALVYVALHRKAALRTWPAALLFAPAAAWMAIHLPLLFQYADPRIAWQPILTLSDFLGLPQLLFGPGLLPYVLLLLIGATVLVNAPKTRRWVGHHLHDAYSVAPSLLAIAIVCGMGFVRPSFAPRYLIPMIPGMLLGISIWARATSQRSRPLPHLLVLAFLLLGIRDWATQASDPKLDLRRGYSWEEASAYLLDKRVQRLIFLWDNPSSPIVERRFLGRVGAFFLHRSGSSVSSDSLVVRGSDPGLRDALIAAANDSNAKSQVVGTLVLAPVGRDMNLAKNDPRWTCKRFGGPAAAHHSDAVVTACYRVAHG